MVSLVCVLLTVHVYAFVSTAYICAGPHLHACKYIYICLQHMCVCVCVCLCLGGGYTLKNTSPQQSEGGRDERQRSQREAVCLQERGLNNGLRWSVAVTLAACVDAYGVLCCAL